MKLLKWLFGSKKPTLNKPVFIKSKHPDKNKIKMLRESILLYNKYGTNNIIDFGRKNSIISIYADLCLKYAIYELYKSSR